MSFAIPLGPLASSFLSLTFLSSFVAAIFFIAVVVVMLVPSGADFTASDSFEMDVVVEAWSLFPLIIFGDTGVVVIDLLVILVLGGFIELFKGSFGDVIEDELPVSVFEGTLCDVTCADTFPDDVTFV